MQIQKQMQTAQPDLDEHHQMQNPDQIQMCIVLNSFLVAILNVRFHPDDILT